MLVNVLGQEDCVRIPVQQNGEVVTFLKVKNTSKDVFLKALSKHLFGNFGNQYWAANTIIIDDSSIKHILNPPDNVVLLDSWTAEILEQFDKFLVDKLLGYTC